MKSFKVKFLHAYRGYMCIIRRGPRSNASTPKDSQSMITYRLVYHPKPLGPKISDLKATFKFGYPRLTLNEGSKVKSHHTKTFPAHDFLQVGLPSQTSRTNNKRAISTFKFGYPRLTLKEGSKVKSDNSGRTVYRNQNRLPRALK